HGAVRDCLLQARVVTADATVVKAGGPTVKNVSGFDLCRLLVGSLGTLGVIGDVILRTRPLARSRRWFSGLADPGLVRRLVHRPSALLWDGTRVWLCLEGHPDDIAGQAALTGLAASDGPPPLPDAGRLSIAPDDVAGLPNWYEPGSFVAEVGVGLVHLSVPSPPPPPAAAPLVTLHARLKAAFDPQGRLNPGRSPLSAPLGQERS
ncbi:MAG TPA: hypothetical protein VF855_04580, partial [Acidimicrobiales bacterium]